ncbi:MAG: hypothetical protein NZU63_09535 [Gemmataceae bacterium]|nr:hypothetical protein [Gemmataceae bacterium]MDW8244419.1 hypothetical protein [Thermogemmata sp.]
MNHISPPRSPWLVSPLFDTIFIANWCWPLLFLPGLATATDTALDFWQIYFLTLPHRWITPLLVLVDPQRRGHKSWLFILVAVLLSLPIVITFVFIGEFICLLMIDYVWNSWHFASQHSGILRMYSLRTGHGYYWLERWGVRLFVTYGALRAAGWLTGWLEVEPSYMSVLSTLDALALLLAVLLLLSSLKPRGECLGKNLYLSSFCLIYIALIISLNLQLAACVVVLASAASISHALEYLAIVSIYIKRRPKGPNEVLLSTIARYWHLVLYAFIIFLGGIGFWLSQIDLTYFAYWQGLNLWIAYLHYAYDGMIWKLRKPQTVQALGVANN